MTTINALEKRVSDLEEKTGAKQERHIVQVVEVSADAEENKTCSGYIMHKIDADGVDEKICRQALEQAFNDVKGTNPFDSDKNIVIVTIDTDVALKTVEILREHGIKIEL